MKCYKKLLMGVACAALIFGSFSLQAAEDEEENEFASKIASGENIILFKIHNIEPVRNDAGDIKECDFDLTLYNRSPKTVDATTMDLSWRDEGISTVIDEEEKVEQQEVNNQKLRRNVAKNANQQHSLQAQPRTEDLTPKMLTMSIALPKIKPFRQVTLKSKLKSDRCFLMMEDVDVSFSSCNISEGKENNDARATLNRGQAPNECKSLFRYVTPRDPEYYREFQKVSFNEDAARRYQARKNDVAEMEKSYNKIIQSANHVTEVLETIR